MNPHGAIIHSWGSNIKMKANRLIHFKRGNEMKPKTTSIEPPKMKNFLFKLASQSRCHFRDNIATQIHTRQTQCLWWEKRIGIMQLSIDNALFHRLHGVTTRSFGKKAINIFVSASFLFLAFRARSINFHFSRGLTRQFLWIHELR